MVGGDELCSSTYPDSRHNPAIMERKCVLCSGAAAPAPLPWCPPSPLAQVLVANSPKLAGIIRLKAGCGSG